MAESKQIRRKDLTLNSRAGVKIREEETGVVEFFMNTFTDDKGNLFVDADREISAWGSFDNTIKDVDTWFWWVNHGYDQRYGKAIVGIIRSAEIKTVKNTTGVYLVGKIDTNTQVGQEMYSYYKLAQEEGRSVPHSFGFKVAQLYDEDSNVWINKEYKVYEVSTLTQHPANKYAQSVVVKSEADDVFVCKSCSKAYETPFLHNGSENVKAYNLGIDKHGKYCPHCGGPHEQSKKVKSKKLFEIGKDELFWKALNDILEE